MASKKKAAAGSARKGKTRHPEWDAGAMVRKAREAAGISQEELAVRLKTKRTAISRIENHADDIKVSTLSRVAKAIGKELKIRIG